MLLVHLLAAALPTLAHHHLGSSAKCVSNIEHEHRIADLPFDDAALQTALVLPSVPSPPLEVLPLDISGPSINRVDLVFFADGYLAEERDKFIEDAMRLADDISGNQTFDTVKPLMNFWAAFTPSKESGVGVGGKPKDTVFGLYRDGTELRGVYYAKPKVAAAACASLGTQCDYPILMGNDPLYGGLGGRFTFAIFSLFIAKANSSLNRVITPSLANGALILRHELGHSIIKVGEEYDGGYAYSGPNAYSNLSEPVPWSHWLTDPSNVRLERSVMPMQDYAWTLLNTSTPWSITFDSSGTYARHLVRFSLSGVPDQADLRVELDGVDLGWVPRRNIGVDRWHYDVHRKGGLSPGPHTLSFTLLNTEREPEAQICNAEMLEFGDESEFISTPGHYSLYPTYSIDNITTYRPTNEDCLMRIVTTPNFCKACLEGLWLSLLRNVSLIDSIDESCASESETTALTLRLVPLAQFRAAAVADLSESYTITWSAAEDGKVLDGLTNKTQVSLPAGSYTVNVKYTTSEVRVDSHKLLTAQVNYTVSSAKC
ncbi:IgA peptidase M64-domain-containing protein [Mycena amicta]|nr:IgA peptidase M64-domain-containing protein [Mycena amicta]